MGACDGSHWGLFLHCAPLFYIVRLFGAHRRAKSWRERVRMEYVSWEEAGHYENPISLRMLRRIIYWATGLEGTFLMNVSYMHDVGLVQSNSEYR
jgi:hypothetical protein